jgi:cytochrome c oxidase subunit 2
MNVSNIKIDRLLTIVLLAILAGMPLLIDSYNSKFWQDKVESDAKVFFLTGHMEKGWVVGNFKAYEVVSFQKGSMALQQPVLKVKKGNRVVLKLTSSDVIHGFSLKEFGVFITEGILPGKVTMVSFIADKTGTYTFTCNSICGKKHDDMTGTLVVTA